MKFKDPRDSMMRDMVASIEKNDVGCTMAMMQKNMNEIAKELQEWINSKSVYDLPFIAAAMKLTQEGLLPMMDESAAQVYEVLVKILGVVSYARKESEP